MGFMRKLFASLVSNERLEAMKAESEDWMVQCPCGHENSVWALGGIRYKARSTGKRTLLKCQQCGKRTWHRYYRKSAEQPPTAEAK
jgi:transcription elongation factor Elf1